MKIQFYIIFILLVSVSCSKKEKDFDSFEYSYGGTFSTVFSIQFTNNDTLYLREHWNAGERSDGKKFPKEQTNYFALLTKNQRSELSDLINRIDFGKIKSEYFQDYEDGSAYQLIIEKEDLKKTIFVHSNSVPKELDSLANWIYNTKENLELKETNKEFDFQSINGILSPAPPPEINVLK